MTSRSHIPPVSNKHTDFGSRGNRKVNIFVLNSHNKLQIMLTENTIFLWKRKTTVFWQKNTAFWQNHGIHRIWRKSRFPWFPWLSTVPNYILFPQTENYIVRCTLCHLFYRPSWCDVAYLRDTPRNHWSLSYWIPVWKNSVLVFC